MTTDVALSALESACRARHRVVVRPPPPPVVPEPGPGGRAWEPSLRDLLARAAGSRFHNLCVCPVAGPGNVFEDTQVHVTLGNPYWSSLTPAAQIWERSHDIAVVHDAGPNLGMVVWVDGYLGRATPIASSLAAFLLLYARFVERARTSSDAAFPFGSAKLIAEDEPFVARIRAGTLPEWEPDEEADALFQQVLREADRRAR